MKEEIRTLTTYRIERAYESLEEARILLEQKHLNTFVNRVYYACFYAVSALLLSRGLSSSKHSGVRSLFHRNFVKPCIVEAKLGQLYDKLFDNRQKGDYADLIRFDSNIVGPWYDEAKGFVKTIEDILKNKLDE